MDMHTPWVDSTLKLRGLYTRRRNGLMSNAILWVTTLIHGLVACCILQSYLPTSKPPSRKVFNYWISKKGPTTKKRGREGSKAKMAHSTQRMLLAKLLRISNIWLGKNYSRRRRPLTLKSPKKLISNTLLKISSTRWSSANSRTKCSYSTTNHRSTYLAMKMAWTPRKKLSTTKEDPTSIFTVMISISKTCTGATEETMAMMLDQAAMTASTRASTKMTSSPSIKMRTLSFKTGEQECRTIWLVWVFQARALIKEDRAPGTWEYPI